MSRGKLTPGASSETLCVKWHNLHYRLYCWLVFRKKDLYLIITQNLTFHEIRRISWNPADFIRISWNPADFIWISWNLVDFTLKSNRFHHEIWQISGEIWQISPRYHLWNPPKIIKASVSAKTLQFDECRVGAMTKDFMKSTRFHPEIWWISPMKSGRFHPDFTCEIHPNYKSKCFSKNSSVLMNAGWGISPLKSSGFHPEIWWISTMKPGRFHLWNPPKIIKASVLAKTLQFDECRVGDFTLEIHQISPWNLVDLTCEIWWI